MRDHRKAMTLLAIALSLFYRQLWAANQPTPGSYWSFDGTLLANPGSGNDAYAATPAFAPGHQGLGLRGGDAPVVVPDRDDLRLAPGLTINCWVKLASLPSTFTPIVIKNGEYQLRVDPLHEGSRFAFFVYADGGWEPRVSSKEPARIDTWYHLIASWDGQTSMLSVNDDRTERTRTGTPAPSCQPVRIGQQDGIVDELRIVTPGATRTSVGRWELDGNLRDTSGHGHDLVAPNARFVAGHHGQALLCETAPIRLPDDPNLRLAPGLRIDCSVFLERQPNAIEYIVYKPDEYQLRVNPPAEGSQFAFFVKADGRWERRAESEQRAEPGKWYRLAASWDGLTATLEVNGTLESVVRSGTPHPRGEAVRIGSAGMRIDELRIENPQLPLLRIRTLARDHAIPRIGRPETLTAVVCSLGVAATGVVATLELPAGIACLDGTTRELGCLSAGEAKPIAWTVKAATEASGRVGVHLTANRAIPVTREFPLAFFAETDAPAGTRVQRGSIPTNATPTGLTYYVDSAAGGNANSGRSPAAAWRDFTPINDKTLGPGDRLLIRRGSVIRQELRLTARATPDNWAQIATYGTGARPIIRRDWDIGDRCVLVRDPDYLRIAGLTVCCAAKGLVVHYSRAGHAGLVIEDCIAHHIEGLYRPDGNGIPEWRGRPGPEGDGFHASAGFAVTGTNPKHVVVRDCEMFQNSWGFFIVGENVDVDRVFCHDEYVYNTSPHPALVGVRHAFLRNSVFDASGYHAFAGTMGIMLVDQQWLTIRNCTFRNLPDAGNHDEGGIDFENRGDGCLIDQCTFENNAGAAIEVLGLETPQARNIEIRRSHFIRNNTARKLGPSEVYVWGKNPDPEICCSTGFIHDNGYITNPGVAFYTNEAPQSTLWTLRDNTPYPTPAALAKAIPLNRPPTVNAGPDITTDQHTVNLSAAVHDDTRPSATPPHLSWELLEGDGNVTFANPTAPVTTATVSKPGDYLLRVVVDDGELWTSEMLVLHALSPGRTSVHAWEFNAPLDKQGWTEVNPGTRTLRVGSEQWPCVAHPVKYAAGGYYIVAVENSPDAHLLSPDALGIDIAHADTIVIRFQNHTPATRMTFRFTTNADTAWTDAKSRAFDVVANDTTPRVYTVSMSDTHAWTGHLKQLRLDLADGTPLTGTCRIDYIRIESPRTP